MLVVLVDDDQDNLEAAGEMLRSEGYETKSYSSLAAARAGLAELTEPLILLLDHDFGEAEVGYSLCEWVRETHPLGLILPIIYLTGRESGEGFLAKQRSKPYMHPTLFLSKASLSIETGELHKILADCSKTFEGVLDLAESQAARRALQSFWEGKEEHLYEAEKPQGDGNAD